MDQFIKSRFSEPSDLTQRLEMGTNADQKFRNSLVQVPQMSRVTVIFAGPSIVLDAKFPSPKF